MMGGNIRAELLETARSLNSGGANGLSIAALCKTTGLSRTKIRRYFPTNGALNAALRKQDAVEAAKPYREPKPEPSPPREDWLERRLRVFERALSLLETRTEETAREQSEALSLLEEKLSSPAPAPLAATEPPPIVVTSVLPLPGQKITYPIENAFNFAPPESFAIPEAGVRESRPEFQVREKMQRILQNAQLPEREAARVKPFEIKRTLPWILICTAVTFTTLMIGASLVVSGSAARAKHGPIARTEQAPRQASNVVIIDATGAIPNPNTQQISAGARSVIARAEGGDAHAQTQTALAFLRGDGVDPDPMTAVRWSQAAAAQGEANAQFILGSLYAEGIKPNPALAVQWYSMAAAQGNAKAMHNLAIAFLNGQGVPKDLVAAIGWLTRAANSGYRDSAFDLAVLYESGEGVAQSPQDALRWYDAAASLGDSQAAERAKFLRSQLSQIAGN
jgi:AcrR family transcriptional regulator